MAHYCSDCNAWFKTKSEFNFHFDSVRHWDQNDKNKEWKFRASPKPLQWREEFLKKWLASSNKTGLMSDSLENVEITVDAELNQTVLLKMDFKYWNFRISSKSQLKHIALLFEAQNTHFAIIDVKGSDVIDKKLEPQCQQWTNESVCNNEATYVYMVKVRFSTTIFGVFRQDVLFDFGSEPILVQKLRVSPFWDGHVKEPTSTSCSERWNNSDVQIIQFENAPYSLMKEEKDLISRYLVHQVFYSLSTPKKDYSTMLHELLYIEEMAQSDLLSRYNIQTSLKLTSGYLLTSNYAKVAKFSQNGELFAYMVSSTVLSEDTSSGRLILGNCNTVLLAPVEYEGNKQRKVYEAIIEDKEKMAIYLRLSKECCEDLKLRPGQNFSAEVQFQLNRLPFCEKHFAVDQLGTPSIVFPNVSEVSELAKDDLLNRKLDLIEPRLNPKQREAVLAIATPCCVKLPPALIIGPFGTGKTFTLAQAVKIILDDPTSKILICTHSNSAADVYIREYLHPEISSGRRSALLLRIYYRHRRVETVHPTVRRYCLFNWDSKGPHIVMPSAKNVKDHRIVVTTLSTSRCLVQLGLEKGFFTHILIDEAAQVMECEALMPLSLADENTRIVLAGDHMQLCPEVYSSLVHEQNLNISILERLNYLYPSKSPCKVLLCENYRSHSAIVRYTSELFYNRQLKARSKQPYHDWFYPLTFFTVKGEDVQGCDSTSFHNDAEVYEVVERVCEIIRYWPASWGVPDDSSIGIVTPYYDQVIRIRSELRKRGLNDVSVERVLNVQGKEFRAVVISTVRTRKTCSTDVDNYGFLSNARLLNTAVTRAQSLICVVGDPIALCSVGKCKDLWLKFINVCHKERSLYGISLRVLKSQLENFVPVVLPEIQSPAASAALGDSLPRRAITKKTRRQHGPVGIFHDPTIIRVWGLGPERTPL